MSQVCVRDEFNDLLHSDILSVDIKQFGISWKSECDGGQEEPTSAHAPFQGMNLGTASNVDAPIKLQAECDFINVFLKQAHGNDIVLERRMPLLTVFLYRHCFSLLVYSKDNSSSRA